jgi:signal transduction histidine kinase
MSASYLRKNFQGEILNEFLSIIEQEALRLNELTTGFLGYSRPAPLAPGPCDLNAVIRSTADLVRQEATDRNIELVVLTDEGLPRIIGDQAQLKQALLNLLVNAMDASGEGGTITVTSGAAGSGVAVAVQDTGAGIPQGELEKIFKPFYTTKTRGAGLGLAIVERIVKAHRGTITAARNKDRGATFTMTLPTETHAER